ncbi:unnamed protein product, partial [Prorocentrum cordatum]
KHALTDIDGNPREAEPGEAPLEISADCKAFMKINDVCSAEIEEHCSSDFYGGDIMIRSAGASPSGPSRRRSELAARRRCRSRRPRRRGGRRGEGRLEGEAEGGQAAGDEGHQEGGQGPEAPPPPQEERPVRWRAARPPRARAGSSGLLYFPLSPARARFDVLARITIVSGCQASHLHFAPCRQHPDQELSSLRSFPKVCSATGARAWRICAADITLTVFIWGDGIC